PVRAADILHGAAQNGHAGPTVDAILKASKLGGDDGLRYATLGSAAAELADKDPRLSEVKRSLLGGYRGTKDPRQAAGARYGLAASGDKLGLAGRDLSGAQILSGPPDARVSEALSAVLQKVPARDRDAVAREHLDRMKLPANAGRGPAAMAPLSEYFTH